MKNFIILLSFFFSALNILAQNNRQDTSNTKFMLSFEPTYISINGFKLNQEFFALKSGSIMLSEELYASEGGNNDFFPLLFIGDMSSYDKVYGFGISLGIKKYLFTTSKMKGFYSEFDVKYSNISIEDYTDVWLDDPVTQNQYLENNKIKNNINKTGLDLRLGFTLSIRDKVFFDFYTGVGIRYSSINTFGDNVIETGNSVYDYGYTGVLPILGVKLGVGLF